MNLGVHMMNYVLPLFCLGSLMYASMVTMSPPLWFKNGFFRMKAGILRPYRTSGS
jgi:hypothetical protein